MTFANCQSSSNVSAERLGIKFPSPKPELVPWLEIHPWAHHALPLVSILLGSKRNNREISFWKTGEPWEAWFQSISAEIQLGERGQDPSLPRASVR